MVGIVGGALTILAGALVGDWTRCPRAPHWGHSEVKPIATTARLHASSSRARSSTRTRLLRWTARSETPTSGGDQGWDDGRGLRVSYRALGECSACRTQLACLVCMGCRSSRDAMAYTTHGHPSPPITESCVPWDYGPLVAVSLSLSHTHTMHALRWVACG